MHHLLSNLRGEVEAVVGEGVEAHLDPRGGRIRVRFEPDILRAAILVMAQGASTAVEQRRRVMIRARLAGRRLWLNVACTVEDHQLDLEKIRRFAAAAHGRIHVRSRAGHGTIVSLNLPTILSLTGVDEAAAQTPRHFPTSKEMCHEEERQPAAV